MTPPDDYLGDMPKRLRIDDATAEQLLVGQSAAAGAGLEPLAMVVRALREVAGKPVSPTAGLAEQMATGVFTAGPVYRYRPAGAGAVQVLLRVLRGAVAVVGRMSLAAKLVAVGVVAGSLSFSTAGFARTLPDPMQNGFERMVESVVPYQFPERTAQRDQMGGTGDQPADQPGQPDGPPPAETTPPADPTSEPEATPTPTPSPTADDRETRREQRAERRCEQKPERCQQAS